MTGFVMLMRRKMASFSIARPFSMSAMPKVSNQPRTPSL
jgi:hypothetical protein